MEPNEHTLIHILYTLAVALWLLLTYTPARHAGRLPPLGALLSAQQKFGTGCKEKLKDDCNKQKQLQ